MSPATPSTTPLTQAQRVKNGTLLLRQYAAQLAIACIRKQRDGVCPPEDVESLRWLLCALEALGLPSTPAQTVPAPAIPLPTAPVPASPRRYHLLMGPPMPAPAVFTLDNKFDLLLEAARRYPLLRVPTTPFQLYGGPRIQQGGCCVVYWDDIVGKPDLVTKLDLTTALAGLNQKLTKDVPVFLRDKKTVGKYPTGTIIPAAGLTMQQVLEDIAAEAVYPTYTPADLVIRTSMPLIGEVGEPLVGSVTTQFYRNDAGGLADLSLLQQVGPSAFVTLRHGATSIQTGLLASLGLLRTTDGYTFIGQASYGAGQPKLVVPGNLADPRPAQVRNVDAPQAAEANYQAPPLTIRGVFRIFFGPAAAKPTVSALVRGLANGPLSSDVSGQVTLDTGTTLRTFVLALPPGMQLRQVLDLTASSADITPSYQPTLVAVEDAHGDLHPFTVYVMEQAVLYNVNHQHRFFF